MAGNASIRSQDSIAGERVMVVFRVFLLAILRIAWWPRTTTRRRERLRLHAPTCEAVSPGFGLTQRVSEAPLAAGCDTQAGTSVLMGPEPIASEIGGAPTTGAESILAVVRATAQWQRVNDDRAVVKPLRQLIGGFGRGLVCPAGVYAGSIPTHSRGPATLDAPFVLTPPRH